MEGSLEFDPARAASASVNASITLASIDVTNDRLMSRLMDPDRLGGKAHPTITFESTRVEAVAPAHWKVTGDLQARENRVGRGSERSIGTHSDRIAESP